MPKNYDIFIVRPAFECFTSYASQMETEYFTADTLKTVINSAKIIPLFFCRLKSTVNRIKLHLINIWFNFHDQTTTTTTTNETVKRYATLCVILLL